MNWEYSFYLALRFFDFCLFSSTVLPSSLHTLILALLTVLSSSVELNRHYFLTVFRIVGKSPENPQDFNLSCFVDLFHGRRGHRLRLRGLFCLMLAHQIDPTPSAAPGSSQMLAHLSPDMSRRCM